MMGPFQGELRWLSNFYLKPITCGGLAFPSAENLYQASKCAHAADRLRFTACGPGDAKRLGRMVELRPGWEDMKLHTMERVLRRKFRDPGLRAKLLATGDAPIIEVNTWGDVYWGVFEGRGCNHLGRLLERVRSQMVAEHGK